VHARWCSWCMQRAAASRPRSRSTGERALRGFYARRAEIPTSSELTGVMRLLLLTASTLLCPLPAQRSWIVDPRGGGDFPDLAPAVAASSPGDTLILRYGPFNGTVIDKGIRIVTDMWGSPGVRGRVTVRAIPPSETCVRTS